MVKPIEDADFSIDNPIREDHLNKLLVVEPIEFEKDIKTTNGPADAVRANVYVVRSADGSKYDAFEDTLIFARAMVRVLKSRTGKIVVGRLAQGQAKQGQSAPWLLTAPSEKDKAAAKALVAALSVESVPSGASGESYDDGASTDDGGEF